MALIKDLKTIMGSKKRTFSGTRGRERIGGDYG